VSSLLSVQADGLPPGVMQAALLDSVGRVRSMALVHQQLYALDSLARIDLRRYVDELAPGLARAFRPETRLRTEGEGIEVSAEVAVPLGLIVNELVSNALKHAFPASAAAEARPDEPWDIRVTIRRGELGLVLHVDDHGPGFSAEVPQRSGSLGLTLIRSLVRQLRGRFVVRSDGGARVEVHVPLG
jgi:two-component sensor histidine kinase